MNRRILVLTIAALTVAVVGLTLALIVVASDDDGASPTTTSSTDFGRIIPTVIARTQTQAEAKLGEAGFEVTTAESVPNDAAQGTVLEQDPPAGSRADEGSTVTLIISAGL